MIEADVSRRNMRSSGSSHVGTGVGGLVGGNVVGGLVGGNVVGGNVVGGLVGSRVGCEVVGAEDVVGEAIGAADSELQMRDAMSSTWLPS